MSPVEVIQKLLKVNKTVANFILAGLAVLAAASIAVTWIGENPNALLVAGYIIGLAFVATIIAFVVNNKRMCMVLGWAVTLTLTTFLVGLVDSALQISGRLPTPVCYVRILWEHPDVCEARSFPTIEIANLETSALWHWPIAGAAKIWRAQTDPVVEPRAVPYDAGPIFLHFGGALQGAEMIALSQDLTQVGWPIVDAKRGGEKIAKVPDKNQVRFFDPESQADAIALAKTVKAQRPGSEIVVRDFSKSGLVAKSGLLEIWLTQ